MQLAQALASAAPACSLAARVLLMTFKREGVRSRVSRQRQELCAGGVLLLALRWALSQGSTGIMQAGDTKAGA